jgi:hypothetical protein
MIPPRLYKYMRGDENGVLRLFRDGMLRFTQPVEFNDPFEMQPFLKGLADEPTIENQFHEEFGATLGPEIEAMLAELTPEQRARVDGDSIRKKFQQQAPQVLSRLKTMMDAVTPLVGRRIYNTVNENLGALCLTEEPTSLLMWTHYAHDHKGAVIEFDAHHAFFSRRRGRNDDFRHFRKVTYTQHRPEVFLADSNAIDFFYFKSTEWEYEHEWRLIVPLADCSKRIDRTPPDHPVCLFHVPPECIRSIIVGCRMPDLQKFQLTKLVRSNPHFRHVAFEQAEADDRIFAIRRVPIAPDALDRWISNDPY